MLAGAITVATGIVRCADPGQTPIPYGGLGGGIYDGGIEGGQDADSSVSPDGGADAADGSSADASMDPEWVKVAWESQCGVEVAGQPHLAVPPLVWSACPDMEPGCSALVINWDTSSKPPIAPPSVIRWGNGYRVGIYSAWSGSHDRAAVYDVDGTPLVAWRVPEQCVPITPLLGVSHVWFGAQAPDVGKTSYIVEPYSSLSTATKALPVSVMSQARDAIDDVFALWLLDGRTVTLFDRTTGLVDTFGPSPGLGYKFPHPVGDFAIIQHSPGLNQPKGYIWSRTSHGVTPLLDPPGEVIPDMKTDGSTLVWVQTPPFQQGQSVYPQGDLWTSPFAATTMDLVPSKRRPAPLVGTAYSSAGEGFYALWGSIDKQVHVYRLSDARHWSFAPPPKALQFREMVYVNSDEVWFQTLLGLYRQKIQDLGPGDPAP